MSFLRRLVTVVVAPLALLLATGLLAPVPSLEAYNPTATELQVLGTDGVPFLRLGRSGTLGNAASPRPLSLRGPLGCRRGTPRGAPRARRPLDTPLPTTGLDLVRPAPPGRDLGAARRARPSDCEPAGAIRHPPALRGQLRQGRGGGQLCAPAGGVVTSLTSPMQPALGLTVALLPGRFPDVYLQNSGTTTVTVLGEGGEPFAQIGPQGVRVNLRSPIHDADPTSRRGDRPRGCAPISAPRRSGRTSRPLRAMTGSIPVRTSCPSWTIPLHLGARTIPVREHADGQGARPALPLRPPARTCCSSTSRPRRGYSLGVQAGLPRYRRAGGSGQGGADEGQGQAPRSHAPPGAVAHTAGHRDGV